MKHVCGEKCIKNLSWKTWREEEARNEERDSSLVSLFWSYAFLD